MRLVVLAALSLAALAFPEDRATRLQSAASLIMKGDLKSAEGQLHNLLAEAPDDPLALNLLGLVEVRQSLPDDAERLFRHAIQVDPSIPGPHLNLARLLAAKSPDTAISELAIALKLSPDSQDAAALLQAIVKNAAVTADLTRAESISGKALAILPSDPDLLYDSASIAFRSNDYSRAELELTRALDIRPGFLDAHYLLARTYLSANQAESAEKEMRTYLTAKPEDASAQYGLGYILAAEQRIPEAKTAFQRSVELAPKQSESFFQLGEISDEEGQAEEARIFFQRALQNDPNHAGAVAGLAILSYRSGDYLAARQSLEKAIALAPGYQKAHYYYALTLSKLGYKEQAGEQFEIARSLQKPHTLPGTKK
jgi:Tfp pilus assembly protein PilF